MLRRQREDETCPRGPQSFWFRRHNEFNERHNRRGAAPSPASSTL
jgi:hypothetical protein